MVAGKASAGLEVRARGPIMVGVPGDGRGAPHAARRLLPARTLRTFRADLRREPGAGEPTRGERQADLEPRRARARLRLRARRAAHDPGGLARLLAEPGRHGCRDVCALDCPGWLRGGRPAVPRPAAPRGWGWPGELRPRRRAPALLPRARARGADRTAALLGQGEMARVPRGVLHGLGRARARARRRGRAQARG